MNINEFIGNKKVIESLCDALTSQRLSHSIIIAGARGFGTNYLSKLLAADIVGATEQDKKLILQNQSPLVQAIEGSGASGQIKVSEIRDINSNVNFSSLSGEKRVVLVKNCENLNVSSANALLKNIEEPKDGITYIFTTNDISRLLVTIRSRCTVYTLASSNKADCEKFFNNVQDKKMLGELIDIYNGNIGLINNAVTSPKRLEILQKAIGAMEDIAKKDKYSLAVSLFYFNKKKEDFKLFLNDLEYICKNRIDAVSVNLLNAIMYLRKSFEKNANLSLIIQNFITAV